MKRGKSKRLSVLLFVLFLVLGVMLLFSTAALGADPAPQITSVSPAAGLVRQAIIISGSGFGASQGSSYVSFGSVQATQYAYWFDGDIYCRVPVISAGQVEVKVTVNGNTSNGASFTVTESPANGWYFQDSGTTNALNVVRAVNADTAWAIGPGGTILKTTNGGTAWVPQVSGTSNTIVDISAVSADIAFAIGYGYEDRTGTFAFFLKTTNGGATWTYQAFDSSMLIRMSKVTAADATNIWVAGYGASGPTYLKSSDSGSTWTVLNTGIEGNGHFDTYGFRAIDTNNVWAVGGMRSTDYSQGFVINTTDGGTNWSIKYFGPIVWQDVSTIGTQDVWIVGNQYFYYPPINKFVCSRSTDGGSSWSDVSLGSSRPHVIEAMDSNTLWTMETGRIWKTIDGGTNWSMQTDFSLDGIYDLSAFNKDVAWAVGGRGSIVHTTGGGLAAAPIVTSVEPNEGSQLSFGTNVTIEGNGFLPGAGVRLEKGGATGEATNVNVVSASQITCSVFLFGSEPGAYDVVVKNPDGQEARLAGGFTVTSQCGSGSGVGVLVLGLTLGLLSLGCESLRKRRRTKS